MKNKEFIRWELHSHFHGDEDIVKVFHITQLTNDKKSEVYEEISEICNPETSHVKKWPRYVTYHIGSEHITDYETGSMFFQIIPQLDHDKNAPIFHQFLLSQRISTEGDVMYILQLELGVVHQEKTYLFHLQFRQQRQHKKMIPFYEPWNLYSISYSLTGVVSVYTVYKELESVVKTIYQEFMNKMTKDLVSPHFWRFFETAYHFQKGVNHGNLILVK